MHLFWILSLYWSSRLTFNYTVHGAFFLHKRMQERRKISKTTPVRSREAYAEFHLFLSSVDRLSTISSFCSNTAQVSFLRVYGFMPMLPLKHVDVWTRWQGFYDTFLWPVFARSTIIWHAIHNKNEPKNSLCTDKNDDQNHLLTDAGLSEKETDDLCVQIAHSNNLLVKNRFKEKTPFIRNRCVHQKIHLSSQRKFFALCILRPWQSRKYRFGSHPFEEHSLLFAHARGLSMPSVESLPFLELIKSCCKTQIMHVHINLTVTWLWKRTCMHCISVFSNVPTHVRMKGCLHVYMYICTYVCDVCYLSNADLEMAAHQKSPKSLPIPTKTYKHVLKKHIHLRVRQCIVMLSEPKESKMPTEESSALIAVYALDTNDRAHFQDQEESHPSPLFALPFTLKRCKRHRHDGLCDEMRCSNNSTVSHANPSQTWWTL